MANNILKDKKGNILNLIIPRYEKRRFKILWENTSKTPMYEGTEINLSSNDYDMLLWVFSISVSGIKNNSISACMKGSNCILYSSTVNTNFQVRRQLTYVNDTKYTATVGYGIGGEDSYNAIPLYAIGIIF